MSLKVVWETIAPIKSQWGGGGGGRGTSLVPVCPLTECCAQVFKNLVYCQYFWRRRKKILRRKNEKKKPIILRKGLGLYRHNAKSCSCALHTNKGDLNAGAVDGQANQIVIAGSFLNILYNVESNSQFKGDRSHHFDEVCRALYSSQNNGQRILHSISFVKLCKLPLNKGKSRS